MESLVELGLAMLLVFGASYLISYAIVRGLRRTRQSFVPPEGTLLKIKVGPDFYRARFLGVDDAGWAFSPPVVAGAPQPLRVGEDLYVEAFLPDGVMKFPAKLVDRRREPQYMMVMSAPESARPTNRRESERIRDLEGTRLLLEGKPVSLVDISEGGLRVRSKGQEGKGDCVRIDTPWLDAPLLGYVVEVLPPGLRDSEPQTRVRLTEPLDLRAIKRKAASVI